MSGIMGATTRQSPDWDADNHPKLGSCIRPDFVRVEALHCFTDVVLERGGDPGSLLKHVGIDERLLSQPDAVVPYRAMVSLFEQTASRLECPDFGLRLGKRQHPGGIMGPVDIAMRNSRTLGEAMAYNFRHAHAYCAGAILNPIVEPGERWILQFQILLDNVPHHTQATEHALIVTHLAINAMTHAPTVKEIWINHDPLSPPASYRSYFGCPVRFGQPFSAIVLDAQDQQRLIPDHNAKLYSMATRLIDLEFPRPELPLKLKVKRVIDERLSVGGRLKKVVASDLAIHPRTLQRRLREEGTSFDQIKEEVRKEAAWRYLTQTRVPLTTVASLLGYSEHSAFSRSCNRWFEHTPKELRKNPELAADGSAEFAPAPRGILTDVRSSLAIRSVALSPP